MDNDFNSEPVHYCKNCLSLKIKTINYTPTMGVDYCDECGSTDIESCSIEEWDKLFYTKNDYHFLEGKSLKQIVEEEYGRH